MEAVVCLLDNSEFSRNGDYGSSRLSAQQETISVLANTIIESNMESSFGVIAMGGQVNVIASPCRNVGHIMGQSNKVRPQGFCNFISAIKTAQLALKSRVNKSARQRILLFVGSPMEHESKELEVLGRQLTKNDVQLDVISFGTENSTNTNNEKLEALISSNKEKKCIDCLFTLDSSYNFLVAVDLW